MPPVQYLRRKQAGEYLKAKYRIRKRTHAGEARLSRGGPEFKSLQRRVVSSQRSWTSGRSPRLESRSVPHPMQRQRDRCVTQKLLVFPPARASGEPQNLEQLGKAFEHTELRCSAKPFRGRPGASSSSCATPARSRGAPGL